MPALSPSTQALNPEIQALIILDNEGHRLASKYYGAFQRAPKGPTSSTETERLRATFEKQLHKKSKLSSSAKSQGNTEILSLQSSLVTFRPTSDCRVYVVGSGDESELVLSYVLEGFHDALTGMLGGTADKRTMLDNLEMIMLLIDELCDGGKILECDGQQLMGRVLMREDGGGGDREGQGGQGQGTKTVPLGELTIGQALKQAREQLIVNLGQNGGGM